ncbi:MAG: hypothetical protein HFP81_00230 [Methylococcales symbiont of Hymedesmia sp. n. MRB-2018]|nr:MAG: hypothetical protein HFP81_00230 [Methylococcales symbiont of Hymedesmia sp. n. MRB-2018]
MLANGNIAQSLKMTLLKNVQKDLPNMEVEKHIMLEIDKNSYAFDGKNLIDFTHYMMK